MSAEAIRCDQDALLAKSLLETPEVKRVNRWIEEHSDKQPNSIRRHLLSTSVRLSPQVSPRLHDMAKHCGDTLGLELPLELYAYSSPQFNAACFKPEAGRLYIMFSSALLESLTETELLYVMGHEVGHHIYRHHDIPVGYLLRGKQRPSADLALRLFAWSRYAEFSADRAGALCANDMNSVASALFKLASGLSRFSFTDGNNLIEFSLEEFISQVDDMVEEDAEPGKGAPTQDWFSTHPFSPLRVKALAHFHESELMQSGGFDKGELEIRVRDLMKLMEPGYLEAKGSDARAMRNLFIAAAVSLAELGGGISDEERKVLQQFLGKEFDLDKLNSEQLANLLPERLRDANQETSRSQRMQLIRDLALVAQADFDGEEDKVKHLKSLAKELQVNEEFVEQCLGHQPELD